MEPSQTEASLEMAKTLMKVMEQLQGSSKNVAGNMNDMTKALSEAFQNTSGLEDFFDKLDKSSKDVLKNLAKGLKKSSKDFEEYQENVLKAGNKYAESLKKKYFLLFPIQTIKKKFGDFKRESEVLRASLQNDPLRIGIIITGERVFSNLKRDVTMFAKVSKIGFGLASSALSGMLSIAMNALDIFKNIVTTAYKLGEAFLMLPYKIFDRIGEAAHTIREEFMQIKQTYEETQQTIDARSIEGKGLVRLTNQARGLGAAFIDTTNIYTRIFGYGLQGQQALISKTGERIAGLGTLSGIFGVEVEKSALAFEVYQQRLAMSAQDMQIAARFALAEQKSLGEVLENRRVQIDNIATKYRLNSKMIASGFNELKSNIIEFGHLSDEALLDVTARAAQLGIEAKELNAVFNKFTTFDQAAESAALLSQTFGMAVDAMQIIKAEDPMQIVEQFRDSMMQTGRSFDDLNRHEKALMSQYTGLSGEALKTAMTFKGVGLSYEDLQKKMEETSPQGKMLSAIKEMTAAVKEFMSAGEKITNPFQAMVKGIEMGITKNKGFRNELINFSNVLQGIYTDVVKYVSGNDKFVGQFVSFIKTFRTAMEGPVGKGFVRLTGNIMTLFQKLLEFGPNASEGIKKAIYDIKDTVFDRQNGLGNLVYGMLDIGKAIVGNIIRGMINVLPSVFQIFNDLIKGITGVMTNNTSIFNTTSGFVSDYIILPFQNVWPDVKKGFDELFNNLGSMFKAFKGTNVYQTIMQTFTDLGNKIVEMIVEGLTKAWEAAQPYVIAYLSLSMGGTVAKLAIQYMIAGGSLGTIFGKSFATSAQTIMSSRMGRIAGGLGVAYGAYDTYSNIQEGNTAQAWGSGLMTAGAAALMIPAIGPIWGGSLLALGGAIKAIDALTSDDNSSKAVAQNNQPDVQQINVTSVASNEEVKEFRRQLSNRDEMIESLQKERDEALYANNTLERKINQRIPPIEIPIQLMLNGTTLTDQILSTAVESRGQYHIGVRPNNSLYIARRDGQVPDNAISPQIS